MKIGFICGGTVSFFASFIMAFILGWKLSLIYLGTVPFMGMFGIMIGILYKTGIARSIKVYAQSAGYAEQALSAIKIVHTYGNEALEINNYKKFLYKERDP